MMEALKLSSCWSYKNYFKGALLFRGERYITMKCQLEAKIKNRENLGRWVTYFQFSDHLQKLQRSSEILGHGVL